MDPALKTVLVSSGIAHPSLRAQRRAFAALRRGLRREIGPSARVDRYSPGHRMRRLEELCDTGLGDHRPALIALYFHHPRVEPAAVAALGRYARDGGALLAIHGASASFKGERAYADLLGASFTGHQAVSAREMRHVPGGSSPRGALPGCIAVTDEVYEHEFHDEIDVWYRWTGRGSSEDGAPAVWTRRRGAGRVACFTPGHRAAVWCSPQVAEVVAGLLDWLLRGEGTS